VVYKILRPDEWAAFEASGTFRGSPDDLRDGYIHLSGAHQVAATAERHFRGRSGLVLAAVDGRALGERLAWEPARDGELFPHLYGPLDAATVRSVVRLELGPDGVPVVPAELPR
jgi:uncharacterized protein (DUF952 family)